VSEATRTIVIAFGAVAGICWLLTVAEWVSTLSLRRWVFQMGPVVVREVQPGHLPPCVATERDATQHARWRSIGPALLVFRYRVRLFGATLHTPFLVKGAIRPLGDRTMVEGRPWCS